MTLGRASSLFVAKRLGAVCALHGQAARRNSLCAMFPTPTNLMKRHLQGLRWIELTASGRLRAISDNWSNMASGNQSLGR
jgi:hypothetical protein